MHFSPLVIHLDRDRIKAPWHFLLYSGIKYVKDLFIENEFKTINDVRNTLDCKANYICEYKIIKSIFKNQIEKLKHHANFINIKNKRTFLFFQSSSGAKNILD